MKDIPQGYKQTKVGIIPQDWEVKSLGEMGNVVNGLTYSPDDIDENGILVLRSSNVQNRQIELLDNVYVNVKEGKYNPVKENDILICVRNGSKSLIGKNAKISKEIEDVAFGAFMTIYRSKLNKYIFQLFDTPIYFKNINRNLGATINSINNNDLKKFLFPIPPLKEQEKIANCLTTWDNAIEKLTQLINLKKARKKGLMQQLLTGKMRLEGFTEPWKEVKLAEVTEKKSSVMQINSFEENSGEYSVYGASGFISKINFYDELEPYIAIVKDGSGVGNIFLLEGKSSVLGTLDKILPINSNLVFIYGLLSKVNFEKYKVGGAIPHIYYKDYSKEKIFLPSIEEQKAIAEILQSADAEVSLLEKKLNALQNQKKGLMQVLLTGKKRLI